MSQKAVSIMWFRHDLRITDNLALYELSKLDNDILPIYIFEQEENDIIQSASSWWLHKSLAKLSLRIPLRCFKGNPIVIFQKLLQKYNVKHIYWNQVYEPEALLLSKKIIQNFSPQIECRSFNSSLLIEPAEVLNKSGKYYSVFTAFWRECTSKSRFRSPLPIPKANFVNESSLGFNINDPTRTAYTWMDILNEIWKVGEEAALEKLDDFIQNKLDAYKQSRDIPALAGTSLLSPHIHFGEISPHTIWHALRKKTSDSSYVFKNELGWREFSYYLLHHFENLPTQNFKANFDKFEWINDEQQLALWKLGKTGIPIVDAGMRELWQTGYMHNRVRMITASFLTKHLLIDWRNGAEWFMYTLLDADLASNSASWQWVAGSGADAAPYFRVFNPVLQGEKFDPDGSYVRRYVPEISLLPNNYIHKPWEAPPIILAQFGITLGKNYPQPIVNLQFARERALRNYKKIAKI